MKGQPLIVAQSQKVCTLDNASPIEGLHKAVIDAQNQEHQGQNDFNSHQDSRQA
jgi:hypothetical protein